MSAELEYTAQQAYDRFRDCQPGKELPHWIHLTYTEREAWKNVVRIIRESTHLLGVRSL